MDSITKEARDVFKSALDHFELELGRLRTGRANAAMLDSIKVEVYSTTMPLNQLGTISAPEAQLLQITPFDPNNISAISLAIRNNQSLGFNPSDDGRVVRIVVPSLTEERRRELAKQINEKLEEALIKMRLGRQEAFKQVDNGKKNKQYSEDEARRIEKTIDDIMNSSKQQMVLIAKNKETEILKI